MNCSWKSVQLKMAKWNGQEESAKQDDGVREAGWLRCGVDVMSNGKESNLQEQLKSRWTSKEVFNNRAALIRQQQSGVNGGAPKKMKRKPKLL